jgi:eukaryotic-like serine/threonine-protein kinase
MWSLLRLRKFSCNLSRIAKRNVAATALGVLILVHRSTAGQDQTDLPAAGNSWSIPGLDLQLVPIPEGSFTLGNPEYMKDPMYLEGPLVQVTFVRPFWMGKFDVTVRQWRQFVDESHYKTEAEVEGNMDLHVGSKWVTTPHADWRHPGFSQQDDEPIVGVSWNDAQQFVRWLNGREQEFGRLPKGYQYSLPSEAEWEYACSSGAGNQNYAGKLALTPNQMGWDSANSVGRTHPVGQLLPNAWGLYDMFGNVWQWCSNWFGLYPSTNGVVDPKGPPSGTLKCFRGCGWCGWHQTNPSWRDRIEANHRSNGIGFRLVLGPES